TRTPTCSISSPRRRGGGATRRHRAARLPISTKDSWRACAARRATGAGEDPSVTGDAERDVLIIGAGAAGGGVALGPARRGGGVDVVGLEQGTWMDPEMLPRRHRDWEVRTRRYWSPSPNIRQWPSDYPIASHGGDPVSVFLYTAVGGSTVGFAGNYWRFVPSGFRMGSLASGGADGPVGSPGLAP